MPWPQRVGQLFIAGRPGDQLSLATARTITSYYFGSVQFITATVAGAAGIRPRRRPRPLGRAAPGSLSPRTRRARRRRR